jgi:co-chaperonin GroES (HSP10)
MEFTSKTMDKTSDNKNKIVIPESVDPTKQGKQFEVTAVGRECKEIKRGDRVITTVAGALGSFENEGKIYYITKEAAVCAVIRG